MKKVSFYLFMMFLVFSFTSCTKTLNQPDDEPVSTMLQLNVPGDFEFETARTVTVSISSFKSSQANNVKYDIYLYNPLGEMQTYTSVGDDGVSVTETIQEMDALSNLAGSYITAASNFDIDITVPTHYNSLYIMKNDAGHYSSAIVPVNSSKVAVAFDAPQSTLKSSKATYTVDMIYAVNSDSEVFQINTETGEYTAVTTIPAGNGGSHTCAIDPVNEILYTVGLTKPYNLLAYDINDDSWETVGETDVYGPRLAYNVSDGLLYLSYEDKIRLIDPSDGDKVKDYKIKDLDDEDGGDITFAEDGSIYVSTTSGIYLLSVKSKNEFYSTRVSGTITNYPTSMAFDSDGVLWWATNLDGKGQVFTFNLDNSQETSKFSAFNHQIDDMDILPVEIFVEDDADNDGAIDLYDEYPNDPLRATNTYVPSISGLGSYAFEDLWPYQGDYDFNDLVLNYRYTNVLNADGLLVETKMYFIIKNVGGSFKNGFGIELDVNKDLVEQVSGYSLTDDIVSLNGQGIEADQAKTVLILFDNAKNYENISNKVMNLTITYTQPIAPNLLGEFNPFIFVNGDRGREVHLPNFKPTSLASTDLLGSGDDISNAATGKYYTNSLNLPWAINIIDDFDYPTEKSPIIAAYLKFAAWAESGGTLYPDWYMDKADYRNNTFIE
ncbi:MAG: LruC domain-containing protein [Bacteroidales bacterium]|nr:LruC domain-containing protein [Bacteroidales bacterium]